MVRHDMFRWLAQKMERRTCAEAADLDGAGDDRMDPTADAVASNLSLAPSLSADVDVVSNANATAIAISAAAIAFSMRSTGDSAPAADIVEEVVAPANDSEEEAGSTEGALEPETLSEQMQPEFGAGDQPESQPLEEIPQDLEHEALPPNVPADTSNPSAPSDPASLFHEQRLRVVEALDKAHKQPVPVCGMPVVELAPAVSRDGAVFRAGYVVNVKAGGRKLSVRFGGSGAIPIFTLRLDGRYRLEGVPSHIASRLVLDVEV